MKAIATILMACTLGAASAEQPLTRFERDAQERKAFEKYMAEREAEIEARRYHPPVEVAKAAADYKATIDKENEATSAAWQATKDRAAAAVAETKAKLVKAAEKQVPDLLDAAAGSEEAKHRLIRALLESGTRILEETLQPEKKP